MLGALSLETETFSHLRKAGNGRVNISQAFRSASTLFLFAPQEEFFVEFASWGWFIQEISSDIVMSNCSLWHITNTSLLRELSSLYYLRFSCELLMSAEGEYTLGGKYCSWNGLGSPLIKCLVCFRSLVSLESALFPRFKGIVIVQSGRKLFGMSELPDNLVRFIH